jgi:serine/threonine protein kinase
MKRPEVTHDSTGAPPLDPTVDASSVDPSRAPAGPAGPDPASRWVVADRYEILGLLGSGGMGTVYRALDRELDDVVALKMLKKQIAAAPGILDRFRREVKLARRVTHRNVARTFDIGEHAGAKFLTMEFIDGDMLGAMLQRRGRLRVAEVTRIGRDLCAGLSAAHAAGVLHRDLKPANVVIARDGRAVITDFGIARALGLGASTQTAGGIVGTPAYMAPEQLEGAPDLDARTDVYALGAMLFELLAGEIPWASLSPLQASLAKLQGPPPDLHALRPTLPDAAVALVTRCMARQRADRFTSVDEVALALEVLDSVRESSPSLVPAALSSSAPSHLAVRTRLAVCPMVNEGAADDQYLAHTLTEDLIDVLSAAPHLRAQPLGDGAATPADVDAVVNGTVRLAGDRLHVLLRLVMREDGFDLWQGRFERPVSEIVAIVDDAAAAMADALSTKKLATPRSMPTNPAAFDLYLRARHGFLRSWYDEGGNVLRLLADSHMLAPGDASIAALYARALARSYGMTGRNEELAARSKEIAEKALVLDPRCADARLALSTVNLFRGDTVGCAIELRRALALAPGDADALAMLGRLRSEVGPLEAAAVHLQASLDREPLSADTRHTLARVHRLMGDEEACERTLGPPPADRSEQVGYLLSAARLALWSRDPRRTAELAVALGRVNVDLDVHRIAVALMGKGGGAPLDAHDREYLVRAFPSDSSIGPRVATFHAQLRAEVHIACDDPDEAMKAMREADANGLLDLMWLDHCPLLERVRGHRDVEAIRRSTALRASRVGEALDGT